MGVLREMLVAEKVRFVWWCCVGSLVWDTGFTEYGEGDCHKATGGRGRSMMRGEAG